MTVDGLGAPVAAVLHVVQAIGLPLEVEEALEELPLDAPVSFAEVARTDYRSASA